MHVARMIPRACLACAQAVIALRRRRHAASGAGPLLNCMLSPQTSSHPSRFTAFAACAGGRAAVARSWQRHAPLSAWLLPGRQQHRRHDPKYRRRRHILAPQAACRLSTKMQSRCAGDYNCCGTPPSKHGQLPGNLSPSPWWCVTWVDPSHTRQSKPSPNPAVQQTHILTVWCICSLPGTGEASGQCNLQAVPMQYAVRKCIC